MNAPSVDTETENSCRRRLQFAGTSRFFFDRLFGHRIFCRLFAHPSMQYAPRVPDVLANLCHDGVECLRRRKLVPNPGDPRPCVAQLHGRFRQHPRYLDYWSAPWINTLVGLHLGVDLIRYQDYFYVLEMNLDPALRSTRRRLYQTRCDPVITETVHAAAQHGLKRVVFWHRWWSEQYREEIRHAGVRAGLETVAAASPHQDRTSVPLPGLPDPLEPNTLYVSFHGRHTALNYYIHDKNVSMTWLARELDEISPAAGGLRIPKTARTPHVSSASLNYFPNVVIKLAGSSRGQDVLMGRFDSLEELNSALGLDERNLMPIQFRSTFRKRVENRIFGAGAPIFQDFIPPEVNRENRPYIYRLHLLVTPLFNRFLSVHKVVANKRVSTTPLRYGLVDDPARYIVNFSHGASYELVDADELSRFRRLTEQLGRLVWSGISRKFFTSAED